MNPETEAGEVLAQLLERLEWMRDNPRTVDVLDLESCVRRVALLSVAIVSGNDRELRSVADSIAFLYRVEVSA